MSLKAYWTKDAEETFDQNITYLKENWEQKVLLDFVEKVAQNIEIIERTPELFPVINKRKNVRQCLVVKQISLFYRIKNEQIELLIFWNNYQNPKKLKFK